MRGPKDSKRKSPTARAIKQEGTGSGISKAYVPVRFAFGSFLALITAITSLLVRTCAVYVARTCGVSCSGIQLRAPMGSDSVYMSDLLLLVFLALIQRSIGESGEVTYSIRITCFVFFDGGRSITSGLPRIGSALSR